MMAAKKQSHWSPSEANAAEPSVCIYAPTALSTAELQQRLCGWWAERKELWDDLSTGLDSGNSTGG